MATPDSASPNLLKSGRIARFGLFDLNIDAGVLLRRGIRIKVQDQSFRILTYLVNHAGEIVTREDLQSQLWDDGTFVDFEHSINTAIKKLRQALDDNADNPCFIETVPRRGYRFIAPVQWMKVSDYDARPEAVVEIPSSIPVPTASRSFRPLWIGAVTVFCAVVAFSIIAWRSKHTAPPPATLPTLSVSPLTSYPGTEGFGALSPDGENVAFSWDRNDPSSTHIYIKQIAAEQSLQLTSGNSNDYAPTWSPDGKYLAYVKVNSPQYWNWSTTANIYIMSALGGGERKVASIHLRGGLALSTGPSMSWSPDGKTIAISDLAANHQNFAIYLLSLDTLQTHQITYPDENLSGDGFPAYSPDGKTLAFIRGGKDASDVFTVPSSGGTPMRVTKANDFIMQGVAWTSDGRSIVYTGFGIHIVPAGGGPSRMVLPSLMAWSPSIVKNHLVYAESSFEENIFSADFDSGHSTPQWSKVFASTHSEEGPRISPDGSRVAFQSTRSGYMEIWVSDRDGSNSIRLTNFDGPLTGSPRWSPDGQSIVFDSRPDGNAELFSVSPNGGQPRQLTHDKSNKVMPSFSHDGRWIYFSSDQNGAWQVWKMPAAGGEPILLTHGEGFTAIESPDGKYVYYAHGLAQEGIYRVPVNGGTEEEVVHELQPTLYGYWAVTDKGIFFAEQHTENRSIVATLNFYSFTNGKTTKLSDLPYQLFNEAPGLEVTPDGRHVMIVLMKDNGADLRLVENFQ